MLTRFRRFILSPATLLALSAVPLFAAVRPAAIQTQSQQFQQPSVILTGSWPAGIESADLDGDGHPDLVYTDYGATATSSSTHVLLNNGTGTFTTGQTIATAGASVVIADLDRDGHPDLIWVWSVLGEGRLYFAHGNGDGTFAPSVELGTFAQIGTNLPQLAFVTAAPMHDSGYLDVLVKDTANSALFELTAGPSLTLIRLFGIHLPDGTGPIATADLNGDGHTDIVIQSSATSGVDVFYGSANGLLTGPVSYSGPNGVQSMLLQDVDADGHLDLILEGSNHHLDILHGFPDGTFATASEGGSGALDPALGTGGHLIGLTPSQHLYTATPAGISLLQLQSNLTLSLSGIFNAGPAPADSAASYVLADFNGDGTPDLALDSPEGIAILFANPDGTLQTSRTFTSGKPALSGALARFTPGGNLDSVISTAATQAQLFHGNPDGTFTALTSPTAATSGPAASSTVLTGDFNGDGAPDIAFSNATGLAIQYGNGDGTFVPVTPISGTLPGSAIAADLNGPATGIASTDSLGDHVLTPQSAGNFLNSTLASALGNPASLIAAGDLNHDGKTDLLYQNGSSWTIYLNQGSSAGNPPGFIPAGSPQNLPAQPNLTATSAIVADLDSDGNGDIVIAFDDTSADHAHPSATPGNLICIWFGNGDGTFVSPVVLTPLRNFSRVAAADMGNNGRLDLVLTDGYLVGILHNLGSRTFSSGSNPGSSNSEQHLLAGSSISSISTGDLNQDGTTDLVLSNGRLADSTGGITALLNKLTAKAVDGSLIASPNSTAVGQTYTITAKLQPLTTGPTATGTITFAVDGVPLGTVSVSAGIASITSPGTAPVGTHTITAQYSGDNVYAGTQLNASHAVTGISTTTVLNITTPFTIFYGEVVNGLALVQAGDNGPLTGTITFYDGVTPICVIPVIGNNNCPASAGTGFVVGTHTLRAIYSGDSTHAGSTSNSVIINVQVDTTNAYITSSLNPAPTGQAITLTATLDGTFAVPTGSVTFLDTTSAGTVTLGSATINASGVAALSTSALTAGTHNIVAVYAATPNFTAATSTSLTQVITPANTRAATAIMIASSANPSVSGQALSLTANVVAVGKANQVPTGTVTFLDGNTTLGTTPLDASGLAIFTSSTLNIGTHGISASYAGDTLNAPGLSPVFLQVVNAPPPPSAVTFAIRISPSAGSGPITLETGSAANILVNVSPLNGFNQAVKLTCTKLPTEASCAFAAATVAAGGGTTTLKLATLSPRTCGSSTPYGQSASLPYTAPVLAGVLIFFLPKRRRALKGLLTLLAMCGFIAMTGCGACTDLGTRPGSYTIQVTGTSMGSSPITVTQTIQINVTE